MRWRLSVLVLLAVAWPGRAGPAGPPPGAVAGVVSVAEAGLLGERKRADRSGVVVYLKGVPGPPPRPLSPPPVMRQRDKAFVPEVLAVTRGTTVEFPNDDKIYHNAFSLSRVAKFDLGLYRGGAVKS